MFLDKLKFAVVFLLVFFPLGSAFGAIDNGLDLSLRVRAIGTVLVLLVPALTGYVVVYRSGGW